MVGYNILLPYPATEIYHQFKNEGRLLEDKWWLNKNYKYGDVPFIPKNIDQEDLRVWSFKARKEFHTFLSITKRSLQLIRYIMDPVLFLFTLSQYKNMGSEVDVKMGVPIGKWLDTPPK